MDTAYLFPILLAIIIAGDIFLRLEFRRLRKQVADLQQTVDRVIAGRTTSKSVDSVDEILPEIRALIAAGKEAEAKKLAAQKLTSPEEFRRLNAALKGDHET